MTHNCENIIGLSGKMANLNDACYWRTNLIDVHDNEPDTAGPKQRTALNPFNNVLRIQLENKGLILSLNSDVFYLEKIIPFLFKKFIKI